MNTLATMAAIAALVGGVTMASAQQGGAPGQPKESGQAEERGPMGRTGGSATNPSPMAPAASGSTTGTAPKDMSKGQPNEQGQQQERTPSGGPSGSTQNPSPR